MLQAKRKRVPKRRDPETGMMQAIPADLDPKYVLDLYLQHPTTSGIAAQLGVRRSSLTLWLRERCPEDWRNVQIARALIRKEDADEGLETSKSHLQLARAREMLRSGQWDLERLDSANYGQKQEVTHKGAVLHLSFTAPQLPQRTTQIIEQEKNELTDES
jgi:hypothetical protein